MSLCSELRSINLLAELHQAEDAKAAIKIEDEELVAEYYGFRQQLEQMNADFREVVTHPTYSIPFLKPGRLVKVKYQNLDFGWGVVLNYQKRLAPKVPMNDYLYSLFDTDLEPCCPWSQS